MDDGTNEELEKATKMMTIGSLFFSLHHTHTHSMNVVDVYIQNRLNDVCTSESLTKALLIVFKNVEICRRRVNVISCFCEDVTRNEIKSQVVHSKSQSPQFVRSRHDCRDFQNKNKNEMKKSKKFE